MIVHSAAWLLPVAAPPIRDGWVAVDHGRIVAVGGPDDVPPAAVRPAPHPRVILPGLVNAHTHLELSYMAGRVPPSDRFDRWVRDLVALRRSYPDPVTVEIFERARAAIAEVHASGTALVGDITNTLITVPLLRDAGLAAHVFYELLGFNAPDPEGRVRHARALLASDESGDRNVRVSLAPHAPYSVSPGLFLAIGRDVTARGTRSSVHLGESRDEIEFLRDGGGAIRRALEKMGAWTDQWSAPGCGPVEYLARLCLLRADVLLIHGVQLTDEELQRVKTADATLVTCPRSNRWTGAGDPPVARFYASGVRVAVGTDSLASVDDLNLFHELAAMRALAPQVPARAILESATRVGAEALGFGDQFGTIEPGKQGALIAVRTAAAVDDVEEYLLRGIRPDDVEWLDPHAEPVL